MHMILSKLKYIGEAILTGTEFKPMKQITDIQKTNETLLDYSGSLVDIALFSISHRRLAIRVTKADTEDVLHLLSVGCTQFH